jgi:tetratricopeptide (TPR) repeat protein
MDTVGLLEQQAIDAAIANEWEKAVGLNRQIVDQDPSNLGAHLRLGFALLQTNDNTGAAKAYRGALKIQPKNHLALENLERIEILSKQTVGAGPKERKNLDPNLFLDVPGKTKTVQLTNLGQKHHLAELFIGQEVELKNKKRRLEVRSQSGNYIGTLPDDISKRLMYFLDEGSVYCVFVKEASLSRILVFIKEISKGDSVKNYISFPQSAQPMYHPLTPTEGEGEETTEDDETKAETHDDDVWEAPDTDHDDDGEDEEKHDLMHIQTGEDDDDSEE